MKSRLSQFFKGSRCQAKQVASGQKFNELKTMDELIARVDLEYRLGVRHRDLEGKRN